MVMTQGPKNIAWLSGMPRSGTTWLSQIFAASPNVRVKFCPLFSHEFKNALGCNNTALEWAEFFREVYETSSPYMDQQHLKDRGDVPEFHRKRRHPDQLLIKSNRFHNLLPYLLENLPQIKMIHMVRHPAAVIYSWLNNPTEFPAGVDPLTEWRTGACRKSGPGEYWGFDDWKSVTMQALELKAIYPTRFKILRYELLNENPIAEAEELFKFLCLEMDERSSDFITRSQATHNPSKRSVFKVPAAVDQWQGALPPIITRQIMEETKSTPLEQFIRR